MKKIAQFNYKWVSDKDKVVRLPNGLQADSKYSLADVLDEALVSKRTNSKDLKMLSHIIPCCRQDKSK